MISADVNCARNDCSRQPFRKPKEISVNTLAIKKVAKAPIGE